MGEAPIANFRVERYYGTDIVFQDLSENEPTSWEWDFGDGIIFEGSSKSTQQNPIYFYTRPGVYSVRLTVSNAFGSDTKIESNLIQVTGLDIVRSDQIQIVGEYYLVPGIGMVDEIVGISEGGIYGIDLGRTYAGYHTDTRRLYLKNVGSTDREVTLNTTMNFPGVVGNLEDADNLLLSLDNITWENELTVQVPSKLIPTYPPYYTNKVPFYVRYEPPLGTPTASKVIGVQLEQFQKEGWQYYTAIPVYNEYPGEDIYIPIILDTQGYARSDEGDVRFLSEQGIELEYEQYFEDGIYKYIVKIPTMEAGITEIIICMGNAFATTTSSLNITGATDFAPTLNNTISPFTEISGEVEYQPDNMLKCIGSPSNSGIAQASLSEDYGTWEFFFKNQEISGQIAKFIISENADLSRGYRVMFDTQFEGMTNGESYLYMDKWDEDTGGYNAGIAYIEPFKFKPQDDGYYITITRKSNGDWFIYINGIPVLRAYDRVFAPVTYPINYISFEGETTEMDPRYAVFSKIKHNPYLLPPPLYIGQRWEKSVLSIYAEIVKEIPDITPIIPKGLVFLDINGNELDLLSLEDTRRGTQSAPHTLIAYNNSNYEIKVISLKAVAGLTQRGTAYETYKACFLSINNEAYSPEVYFNLNAQEKLPINVRWAPPDNSRANVEVEWDLLLSVSTKDIKEVCL